MKNRAGVRTLSPPRRRLRSSRDFGAEAGGQPIIELRGVSRAFGSNVAVRAVDLLVWPKEFLVILGESGSGKTTLLKMINRLQPPDSGDVLIDGQSTSAVAEHELRRRIGYVFQRVGLFPHMTVAENIAVTPRLLGWDEAQRFARASTSCSRS